MGAECRRIDHLGMVEVERVVADNGTILSSLEIVSCVVCDASIALPRGTLDPRRSLKLPVSFQVGKLAHVHEREYIESPYGTANLCRHCMRPMASHTFAGGPDAEGVVWRPARCYAGHHEFHVDIANALPEDRAECAICGEHTTVEKAMSY